MKFYFDCQNREFFTEKEKESYFADEFSLSQITEELLSKYSWVDLINELCGFDHPIIEEAIEEMMEAYIKENCRVFSVSGTIKEITEEV